MDQELRLEQKNQQLSSILNIVDQYVDNGLLGQIFVSIDSTFPEMDFYNCNAFKQSFPTQNAKKTRKKRAPKKEKKEDESQPCDK